MTIGTAIPTAASDFELISEYANSDSGRAFGQIVERYVDLVHAAAMRQVQDAHLAEDVTQAVFLILSQRAGTIGAETVLAGWLLLTTRNVARNALRSEWRLKRRERKVAQMHGEEDTAAKAGNQAMSIGPALDDAMARLNEADRNAILLRFFHAKSHREVGQALGLSEEAAGKRVARAIGKLRDILSRSGATVSEATLTSTLPMLVGKSAPQGLATAIQASLTAGAASPGVAALAAGSASAVGGGSAAMTWAIGAVAAVFMLGAGAYTAMTLLAEPKPSAAVPTTAVAPAPFAPAAPAAPLDARTITIQAIDPQTRQPLVGADVQIRFGGNQRRSGKTDANGRMAIGVPTDLNNRNMQILVSAPGRVPMQMMWSSSRLRGVAPPLVTVPLETGTTIGGIVCDPAGNPVEGARVKVLLGNFDSFEAPSPALDREDIFTDAQGRWQIANAPSTMKQIWVMPVHPNFPGSESESMPMVDVDKLRNQTLISTIRAIATKVSGVVYDPDGKPLPGASVVVANDRYDNDKAQTTTDAEGKFQLAGFPRYRKSMIVRYPGYAPSFVPIVDPEHAILPFQVKLSKPSTLEGFVVDPDGKPIARVNVEVESWNNSRALDWKTTTDSQGHFIWKEAPATELQLNISARGRGQVSGYKITAGGEPPKIVVYPPVQVTGNVIDAETKQPIAEFRIKHGIRWTGQDDVTWQSMDNRTLTNGKYEATLDNISNGGRLMVEAEGYEPVTSRMIQSSEGKITMDFEMKKQTTPATGATPQR